MSSAPLPARSVLYIASSAVLTQSHKYQNKASLQYEWRHFSISPSVFFLPIGRKYLPDLRGIRQQARHSIRHHEHDHTEDQYSINRSWKLGIVELGWGGIRVGVRVLIVHLGRSVCRFDKMCLNDKMSI